MPRRALITGGAGFIGSDLADELLEHGWQVRALDALVPQVHDERRRPAYLASDLELIEGDVRDPVAVRKALDGCEVSSMSIHGEGLYRDGDEQIHAAVQRTPEQMTHGDWDPRGPSGQPLPPVPTPETKQPALASLYALSEYDPERMCLMVGAAYKPPTVALRFFNVRVDTMRAELASRGLAV